MQAHVDAHLAGTLQGEVPAEWLHANNRTRCLVCGLSVAANRGVHPTCRPAYRAAAGNQPADDTMGGEALPSFADIQAGRTRTLRHIPAAAKSLWTRTLSRALAAVVHSNNPRSWQELLMLPQTVLDAPPRGGHKHAKAAAAYTLDRLQRWDAGERLTLWESRRQLRVRHAGPRAAADRQDFAISKLSLPKGLHLTLLTMWPLSVASTQSSQPYPSPQHKPYLLALISRQPLLAVLCAAFQPPQLPVLLASVSSTSVMLACRGAQVLSWTS